MMLGLAIKSLRNRLGTVALTVISIALSVTLLVGVERVREQTKDTFASSVSGTDLIVGARSNAVQLLLASVFRIGNVTANIRWTTYERIKSLPNVAWTIPISLGDSHRGFPVIGTTEDYFKRYRYGSGRAVRFASGAPFDNFDQAVIGADVASALDYRVGRDIVLAHGSGGVALLEHRDHPFRVVGVLARTGTPVDRAIHVSLDGLDAIHAVDPGGAEDPLAAALQARGHVNAERTITAVLIGLESRASAIGLQRTLNGWTAEPLSAILPGPTLLEVWGIVAGVEGALTAIAGLVVLVGLTGMLIALLTGLSERRREIAVLRAVGAAPRHVFALLVGEAALMSLAAVVLGLAAVYAALALAQPWIEQNLALVIRPRWPSITELALIITIVVAGVITGMIPAYRMYRMTLADGMMVRL